MQQYKWSVTAQESGLKLIDFLKSKLDSCSARQIKKAIESNACVLNGRTERFASTLVGTGDKIAFAMAEKSGVRKGDVLFEDADLFIYDKPSGISSEDLHKSLGISSLYLLHRLDKETSGVLLFAKTIPMRDAMLHLFRQRKIRKAYFALVDGIPTKTSGTIDNYLGKVHVYQGQALWGEVDPSKGAHARTEWKVIQTGKETALLLCQPITGRTHQIRVHCSGMGHPILGDYQYGRKFRSKCRPQRCMLHACEVSFIHPVKGTTVVIQAPKPLDMKAVIEEIKKP